ncbi:ANK_REP_REGION domain-containing protein, partial [Haematococcus lacustris]
MRNIYWAAEKGDDALLEALLTAPQPQQGVEGKNLEYRDLGGCTPLIVAAANNNQRCVELLLKHGAKVDAMSNSDTEGGTAFHYAARKGGDHRSVCQLLYGHGANPFLADRKGRTPLDEAIQAGRCSQPLSLTHLPGQAAAAQAYAGEQGDLPVCPANWGQREWLTLQAALSSWTRCDSRRCGWAWWPSRWGGGGKASKETKKYAAPAGPSGGGHQGERVALGVAPRCPPTRGVRQLQSRLTQGSKVICRCACRCCPVNRGQSVPKNARPWLRSLDCSLLSFCSCSLSVSACTLPPLTPPPFLCRRPAAAPGSVVGQPAAKGSGANTLTLDRIFNRASELDAMQSGKCNNIPVNLPSSGKWKKKTRVMMVVPHHPCPRSHWVPEPSRKRLLVFRDNKELQLKISGILHEAICHVGTSSTFLKLAPGIDFIYTDPAKQTPGNSLQLSPVTDRPSGQADLDALVDEITAMPAAAASISSVDSPGPSTPSRAMSDGGR